MEIFKKVESKFNECKFKEAKHFLNQFNDEEKFQQFRDPELNLFISHIRILLRFLSRPEIEFYNFSVQLTVIKNYHKKESPQLPSKSFLYLDFNTAFLNFIFGHYSDSERLLKSVVYTIEKISNFENYSHLIFLYLKSSYLLIEIYFISNNIQNCKKWIENVQFYESKIKNKNESTKFLSQFYNSKINSFSGKFNDAFDQIENSEKILSKTENIKNKELLQAILNIQKAFVLMKTDNEEALNVLHKLVDCDSSIIPVLVLNNISVICHKLGNNEKAKIGFINSLEKYVEIAKENFFKNNTCHIDFSPFICFNIGNCLIKTDPKKAFEYFCEAANAFFSSPKLWLRLGQCCFQYYQINSENGMESYNSEETYYCRECLNSKKGNNLETNSLKKKGVLNCKECNFEKSGKDISNWNIFKFSLNDSIFYFERALILLSKSNDYSDLEETILVNLTCAYLKTGNYNAALLQANRILSKSNFNPNSIYLASTYKAEALYRMKRENESLSVLDPKKLWKKIGSTSNIHKAILFNNLCCIFISKNDLKNAKRCMKKALKVDSELDILSQNRNYLSDNFDSE